MRHLGKVWCCLGPWDLQCPAESAALPLSTLKWRMWLVVGSELATNPLHGGSSPSSRFSVPVAVTWLWWKLGAERMKLRHTPKWIASTEGSLAVSITSRQDEWVGWGGCKKMFIHWWIFILKCSPICFGSSKGLENDLQVLRFHTAQPSVGSHWVGVWMHEFIGLKQCYRMSHRT